MNQIGLKIGGVPEHFNLPWRLAIEEGKFAEIGLDLHWSDMSGGTGQMIRGLESGSLDVAVLLTEGITKSILQGLKAKVIGVYVVTPLSWGIHVPFDADSITTSNDLNNQSFAISRYGSGSQLMAYVMADQHGWDIEQLSFNVVGDVYGGLWSLAQHESSAFLWEKYTTYPFVEQEKCKYIGDVVTPWPCFVVAVNDTIASKYPALLANMLTVVQQRARQVKNDSDTAAVIAWRYNLQLDQVKKWLAETDWNYDGTAFPSAFETATNYLKKLQLITEEESENWHLKLFGY
ncbi:MAG: hypothetical protein ACEQR5_00380 [Moraxellaceae bacterium]|jgi:ABC-type nitrate/sulfonate/bicarbonate transport system substrate-binding protein